MGLDDEIDAGCDTISEGSGICSKWCFLSTEMVITSKESRYNRKGMEKLVHLIPALLVFSTVYFNVEKCVEIYEKQHDLDSNTRQRKTLI